MRRSLSIPVGLAILGIVSSFALFSAPTVAQAPDTPAQASTPASDPADAKEKEKEKEKAKAERRSRQARLERELAIAKVKFDQAKLASDQQNSDSKDALDRANQDRQLTTEKLDDLEKNQGPSRLEKAKHSLKGAEDSLKENEEELAQLEMMYAESELGDKTKEIVIQRAKRRLEQVRWWLNIQQKDLELLRDHSLPIEIRELKQQVEDKTRAVDAAKRAAEAASLGKKIEIMSAESEIARIEQELKDVHDEISREE